MWITGTREPRAGLFWLGLVVLRLRTEGFSGGRVVEGIDVIENPSREIL